jgi:hypothetical protein
MKWMVTLTVIFALAATVAAQRRGTPPAGRASGQPGAMTAIGSAKDIMVAITIPTSNDVFAAASETPKDDAGWEKAKNQALALAESANLLLMPARSGGRAEWNAFAVAQRNAAVVAMKAAAQKDATALSDAADALYETCDNCHKKYMRGK